MPGIQDLEGRVAVVTGGGSGIGRGMCRGFAGEGMKVVVSDVETAAAQAVADELSANGNEAIAVSCDVTDRSAVEALAEATQDAFGQVDVVCNNAGVLIGGPFLDLTPGDWQWVLDVNVMGVVHGSTVFGRILAERGEGHIVNTSSIGGFSAGGAMAPYTASKFACLALSESLRTELAPRGVGVSTLCPGPIDTDLPNADRLRPDAVGPAGGSAEMLAPFIAGGLPPDEVAPFVIQGIRDDTQWIFTHPEMLIETLSQRHAALMAALGAPLTA